MRQEAWRWLTAGLFAVAIIGASAPAAAQDPARPMAQSFVRSRTVDGVLGFETASRTYTAPDGSCEVTLVGVVHLADAAYYGAIVEELAAHDLVLYESVLPRGAFGTRAEGELDKQRVTQDAMLFLRSLADRERASRGRAPRDAAELRAWIVERDTRLARPVDLAFVDAWGRPVVYEPRGDSFLLVSLGRDGRPGGRGLDLDLSLGPIEAGIGTGVEGQPDPPAAERRDLYKELADALGVALQVRSIDYDRSGWEPADLPMEELLDRLWRRGERSLTIEMLSNDGGLAQGVVRFLLSMVSGSPAFKKMVVQALGAAGGENGGAEQGLGEVDRRIILDERNEAVIEHLDRILGGGEVPRRIAIFYGAAHMPDFERRLVAERGFAAGPMRWLVAMSVDEWTTQQMKNRISRFEEARSAILANDPLGAFPEVQRIDGRLQSLRKRIDLRQAAPRSEGAGAP